MCVCVYIYTHMHTYNVHTRTCIHTYIRTYIHTYAYIKSNSKINDIVPGIGHLKLNTKMIVNYCHPQTFMRILFEIY